MSDDRSLDQEQQERLADLAERYCQTLRNGEQPNLDAYVAELPELADEIREVFPALALMERSGGRYVEAAQKRDWKAGLAAARDVAQWLETLAGFGRAEGSEAGRSVFGAVDPEAGAPASGDFVARTLASLEAQGVSSGRYSLESEIARGGQGIVLEAWDRTLSRRLAIKVARASVALDRTDRADTHSLGRFLEEAQVTAQLDHPGIVPVHDLGLDPERRVFFTMKLVKGRDLAAVLALVRTGVEGWTRTRALNVLLKVCEAMAYAHSKGVIHRDLKPSNVMVGRYGEVYVMDWGLARAQGERDRKDIRIRPELASEIRSTRQRSHEPGDSPLVTMDGDVVGTPAYMPPEQARGELDAIGPHSDVYAVGAMLYELLTARTPYVEPGSRLDNRAIWALVQHGPPAPVHTLAPDVPAELVAICEKAMARDVAERYPDMGGLGEDLRAYLEHRVVSAYRTGALAELGKWIRRNRTPAAAGAVALLALAGGLVASLDFRARAVAQAEVSEAVVEFLTEDMIGAALPRRTGTATDLGGLGWNATMLEAVEASAARLDHNEAARGRFEDKPLVEARIRSSLGWVFLCVGKYALAIRHYERAYEIQVRELGESSRDSLHTARRLGGIYCETDQLARAESWLTRNGEIARETLGAGDKEAVGMLDLLGNVLRMQGRFAESERVHKEALEGCRGNLPPGDPVTLGALCNVALAAMDDRRFDEAETLFLEALELQERFLAPDDFVTLITRENLGTLYRMTGRNEEALTQLTLTLDGMRRTQHPNDPILLRTLSELIALHRQRTDPDAARAPTRELLAARAAQALTPPHDPSAANNYAWALLSAYPEDLRDPVTALEQARAACEATNFENWSFLDTFALALHRNGRTSEAIEHQRRALDLCPDGAPQRPELEARREEFASASDER
ncbi:MAG: serine/threonine protein kinase [Planctomycetes bacterium]|nr:serine/threonine protein kinase [Planctomycetota bacterium]